MSDEIYFDGQRFVSAHDAAATSDLTRDYVARLCREGKVLGRRLGKSWYVHEESLKRFLVEQAYAKSLRSERLSEERAREYHGVSVETKSEGLIGAAVSSNALSDSEPRISPITHSLARHAAAAQAKLRAAAMRQGEAAMRFAPSAAMTPGGVQEMIARAAHGTIHVPAHTITPLADFMQKFVAMLVAFTMTFGTYALVDPAYAKFALASMRDSVASVADAYTNLTGGTETLSANLKKSALYISENPADALAAASSATISFIPDSLRSLARAVNHEVNNFVYAIAFPMSLTNSLARTPDASSVVIEIAPYARSSQSPLSATATSPQVVQQIVNPTSVIERERVVERVVAQAGGVTDEYLNQRLAALRNELYGQVSASSGGGGGYTTIQNNYSLISQSQNIDTLGGVTISNSTITGGTITGATITGGSVTATAFDGVLGISNGGTGTSTVPSYGQLLVGTAAGGYSLMATSSLGISSGGSGVSTTTANTWSALQTFAAGASTTDLIFDRATGTSATTTNLFSTNAIFTNLSAGTSTLTNLAVSNTSTSTFAGSISVGGNINFNGTILQNNLPFASSQWTTSGSNIYYNTGNVGIGTSTPFAKLALHALNGETNTRLFEVASSTAGATTTLFAIMNTGNVGIGTGSPSQALHVSSGAVLVQPDSAWSSGDNARVYLGDTSSYFGNTHGGGITFVSNNPLNITTSVAQPIVFNVNSSEVARFISGGNFGIGETSPGSRLSVSGGGTFGSGYDTTAAPTNGLLVEGKLGVGTTSPWAKLAVTAVGGQSNPVFEVASSSAGTTFLSVSASGSTYLGGPLSVGSTTMTRTLSVESSNAAPLLLARTSSGANVAVEITDAGGSSIFFGKNTSAGFSVDSDSNISSSPLFNVDTTGNVTIKGIATGGTECLQADANGVISKTGGACGSGSGAVNSVTNSNGTLTISPTTGNVVASLNLGNANTWTALQSFASGASTTRLSVFGTSYFGGSATSTFSSAGVLNLAGLASAVLGVDASGNVVATSTIGSNLISGTLGTVNGTTFNRGDSITITAASSTLLANNNTWSGTNAFQNITFTNGTSSTFAITNVANAILSTNAGGSVVATTSIGTNLLTGSLGTVNGTAFNRGDSITVTAASSTLLANNNTWSGTNIFTSGLLSLASTTIGAGGQTTGLTIFGGATTTGNAYFAGNVGVGTTTPNANLVVQASGQDGSVALGTWNDVPSYGAIYLNGSFQNAGSYNLLSGISDRNLYFNVPSSSNEFRFGASGSNDLVTIKGTGNVGIGTTSPWAKLAVTATAGQTNPVFEVASSSVGTTYLSVSGTGFGTTTVSGLNINGSATSTSNVGFNITTGCYAVNGTCLTSGGGVSLSAANTWTALQSFAAGASTTRLSVFGTSYFGGSATSTFSSAGVLNLAGLASAVLGVDASGNVVATSTIGTNLLSGSLGTVNGTTFNRGDSITVTAASSTLLSDTNTWSALQLFSRASTTRLSVFDTAYFGGSATSTFNNAGQLSLAGLTNSLLYTNGSNVVSAASVASSLAFSGGSLSLNTGNTNSWSVLQNFTRASTTQLSVFESLYVGGSATTTILGSATSTFGAGVQTTALNVTGSATSTFANGIQLAAGCVLVGGSCIGSGGAGGSGGGQLIAVYATSSVGTSTVEFTGSANSSPSFSTGTGVLTLPSNTSHIVVEVWGGGGGGGGSNAGTGGTGGTSNFGGVATSTGGVGGQASSGTGGSGGSATGGDLNLSGGPGHKAGGFSGNGGNAPRGGSGGAPVASVTTGNTGGVFGGGGSGGGRDVGDEAGSGGGSGAYAQKFFSTLASSYQFVVGRGGVGGNGTVDGGDGGTGGLVIYVYTTGISQGAIGGGATGYLPYYTSDVASTTLSATSSIFLSSAGKFGVGSTTPWANLSVSAKAGQTNPVFEVASSSVGTTYLSVSGTGFGTTTVSGLAINGSATSTSNVGFNITTGCYAVNGTCLSAGASLSAANTWTALQSFASGASTTRLSVFGTSYFGGSATSTFSSAGVLNLAGLSSAVLGADASGNVVATSTIGSNLISGTLGTINGTSFARGDSITVTAASSTLLANNNTWSGTNAFQNITFTNGTSSTFAITNVANAILSTNAGGSVVATTSIGTNLLTGSLGTVNGTAFNRGDSITVTAASSTLLANNNTWSGTNVFTGNVGVGSTTPWAKLALTATAGQTNPVFEVASSSAGTVYLSVSGTGNGTTTVTGLNINGSATSTSNVGFNITTGCYAVNGTCVGGGGGASLSGTTGQIAYFSGTDTAVGTSTISILSSGRVGIGTSTPYAKLTVWGSGTGTGTLFEAANSASTTVARLLDDGTGYFLGNIGVGTTSPMSKLSVQNTAAAAQFTLAYSDSQSTSFQVDSAGDLIINPSGDDVRLTSDNLFVCNGACQTGTTGTGNIIAENKIGIGTSTPSAKLTIETGNESDAATNLLQIASTTNQSIFLVDANGNVGIGTSTPSKQLSISKLLYVGGGNPAGMGTATSTFQGDVLITGKLDVSTIDPVYTIDGVKYATYGHSTIGVKEELAMLVEVSKKTASGSYEYAIPFSKLPLGSDPWLFWQVTEFGENWKDLVVSLTPGFEGDVHYVKDVQNKTLRIISSAPGEVSLRLIADRYDAHTWPNLRPDQGTGFEGHVIQSKARAQ